MLRCGRRAALPRQNFSFLRLLDLNKIKQNILSFCMLLFIAHAVNSPAYLGSSNIIKAGLSPGETGACFGKDLESYCRQKNN